MIPFKEAAKKYRNKTILITGSSGFIGSSLARAFFDVDCDLRLLYMNHRLDVPRKTVASVKLIKGDLSQESVLKKVLRGVDIVFHLAGLEYDRLNFDIYKDLHTNALVVIDLLEVCRKNDFRPRIIFSSSANLFGLANALPLNEKSETDPVSLWSAHKLMAENYLRIYAVKYGICTVILRLANVYGPAYNKHASANVVINKVIANALAGRDILLYRNRECLRDYLYIDDAVNGLFLAGIYHKKLSDEKYYVLGSGEGLTMSKVWGIISDEVGKQDKKKVKVLFNDKVRLEPFDFRDFIADSRLFSRKTGWSASMRLRKGIGSTVARMLPLRGDNGPK